MSDMKVFSVPDSNDDKGNNVFQQTANAGFNCTNIGIQPLMDICQDRDNLNVSLQTYAYAYFGVCAFSMDSSFIGYRFTVCAILIHQRKIDYSMCYRRRRPA